MNETESAGQMIDQTDTAILALLAETYATADAVPAGLVERLKFALALDEVFAEVAHLTRVSDDAMAVRSDAQSATRTETMTFSAESLTAMVTVSRARRNRIRLDGWIAPESSMRVRLRMQGERRQTESDDSGRFSFDNLPDGFAQLTFHPVEPAEADATVLTPLFEL